ncbi:hypothetical protein [Streptomyces naphthomycinicus]|nr:hypothetical protein [Streptomyces sp. TML10]
MSTVARLPTFTGPDAPTLLVTRRRSLYVRWSRGPERDLTQPSAAPTT